MITVVLNSCGRFDLLERTLASFNAFNSYPVSEIIIIDDSGDAEMHRKLREHYGHYTLVIEPHRGLIPCIDDGFSRVKTEFVFKLEDDWEFYRGGFIEKSIKILNARPEVLNVWLRERNDTNGHPIEPGYQQGGGIVFSYVALNFMGQWHGFTFNPSVWRVSDYKKLAPFSAICGEGNMGTQEMNIGQWYHLFGYRGVIMREGYVRHIGWNRRSYSV